MTHPIDLEPASFYAAQRAGDEAFMASEENGINDAITAGIRTYLAARSAPEAGKAVDELTAAVEAGQPFGYDPATGFVHADDGGAPASCALSEREGQE